MSFIDLIILIPLALGAIGGFKKEFILEVVTLLALILAVMKINTPINVTPFGLFAALISSLPLALGLIMIGLFLGAILPNRRLSATV